MALFEILYQAVNYAKKKFKNSCANCGAQNQAFGYRDKEGRFVAVAGDSLEEAQSKGFEIGRIKLVIAHLNHKEGDFALNNVFTLCNRCNFFHKLIKEHCAEFEKQPTLFQQGNSLDLKGCNSILEYVKKRIINFYKLYPEALDNLPPGN